MSELFTQTNKQKRLFRTEEDIVANIQTQFGMPHTGKDLLLDAKMGPNKDQSSRLDSEPDALSDTGMSDDVGAGDTSGILHDSAGGNKNTITGTNTPRSSRASAYYDLLRSQHKNGHYKAPAYRVVDTIESPLQAGASALNYHDDFDTDAVQNAGLHMAVAQTVVEGNIMAAAADSAFVIGKQTGNILKELKDETINAKDALKAGGKVKWFPLRIIALKRILAVRAMMPAGSTMLPQSGTGMKVMRRTKAILYGKRTAHMM
ncbi:MAG: hypothetical protein OGM67_07370 [Oscillospiraceae bacterium]|nr:MAG: hypothetical protein OGM67_07370 [Oscillospiraceae bacterium]